MTTRVSNPDVRPPLILIVDDYPDALEIYGPYLAFRGYDVATASNGAQAITSIQKRCPALVLMDLQMAGLSGTETMRTIRLDGRCPGVLIVAFTAHAMLDEREQALRDGFDHVIAKPCLPDSLCEAIDRILGQAPAP